MNLINHLDRRLNKIFDLQFLNCKSDNVWKFDSKFLKILIGIGAIGSILLDLTFENFIISWIPEIIVIKLTIYLPIFLGWERSRWLNENLCWTKKKEKRKNKTKRIGTIFETGFSQRPKKLKREIYKRRHEEKIMKKKVFTIFTIFLYFSISKNSCQFSL